MGDEKEELLVLIQDISDFVNYKKQLELSKFKTIYFASIAHDLRTPINTVLTINDQLSRAVPAGQSQMLEISSASCKFLLQTIDDVFDLSKLELNQFSLNESWFQLREVLGDIKGIMGIQSQLKGIELLFEVENDVPADILSDPKRLKQVLFNLISNSLKFTKKGFIKVKIKRDECPPLQDDNSSIVQEFEDIRSVFLQVEVEDSGVGIRPESL